MIVHTGEALIDFIPLDRDDGKPAYRPIPGGSPYNSAVATARLGVPNAFLGKISTDFFGDQLIDHLEDNGVGTDLVVRDDRLSTLAFVQRSSSGDARYAFFAENAADRSFTRDDVMNLPKEVTAIQFGSISLIADPVGETIVSLVERERASRVISFDPNIRTSLITDDEHYRKRLARAVAASTVVKISDEDAMWIYPGRSPKEAATEMLGAGVRLVVVTAGSDGAGAYTRDNGVSVPAEAITVADTVGAGDSFHGGVLAWLHYAGRLDETAIAELSRDDLTEMLRYAGAVSAITCSRAGNDPPRLDELPPSIRNS